MSSRTAGATPARPGTRASDAETMRASRPSGPRESTAARPPSSRGQGRPAGGGPRVSAPGSGGARGGNRPESRRPEREYDPRRAARQALARIPLPDDVDARELDPAARKELLTLAKDTAELVARHLVMAGRLLDDAPEQALQHARAARALAGRVGAVREANGIAAYLAGEWNEALTELRTARRMTGSPEHLPVMADCERALGRPERALVLADDPEGRRLPPAARVELLVVSAGARRDLGQLDAAVALLDVAALEGPVKPWTARLRYAYADALLAAGREEQARAWFARALDADEEGETDAEERLLELDGLVLTDLAPEDDEDALAAPGDAES